jgi:hypothetical protein
MRVRDIALFILHNQDRDRAACQEEEEESGAKFSTRYL